jgi:effector-binding domain-containing protein
MFEATIKQTEPMTVAYKTMRGPYSQTPQGYQALYQWIGRHGLQPTGMPEAVYFTSPGETPESEAMWELWAPVAAEADAASADESGIGVKPIEPQTVASAMHKGPYEQVAPVYAALGAWVTENGYRMVGPPRELYYSDPDEVPPEEYLTEIQLPVAHVEEAVSSRSGS